MHVVLRFSCSLCSLELALQKGDTSLQLFLGNRCDHISLVFNERKQHARSAVPTASCPRLATDCPKRSRGRGGRSCLQYPRLDRAMIINGGKDVGTTNESPFSHERHQATIGNGHRQRSATAIGNGHRQRSAAAIGNDRQRGSAAAIGNDRGAFTVRHGEFEAAL